MKYLIEDPKDVKDGDVLVTAQGNLFDVGPETVVHERAKFPRDRFLSEKNPFRSPSSSGIKIISVKKDGVEYLTPHHEDYATEKKKADESFSASVYRKLFTGSFKYITLQDLLRFLDNPVSFSFSREATGAFNWDAAYDVYKFDFCRINTCGHTQRSLDATKSIIYHFCRAKSSPCPDLNGYTVDGKTPDSSALKLYEPEKKDNFAVTKPQLVLVAALAIEQFWQYLPSISFVW